MKRGFTQTLMMVALVAMAAQAMAMAPIIKDIPSPIVGDKDTISPANTFVYPDAIDLSQWVSDRETTDSTKINWYYKIEGSAHRYSVNNCPEVDDADIANFALGAANIDGVSHAKIIAGPGNVNRDTAGTQTAGSCKITIRNKALSPIGGPNTAPADNNAETAVVTLFASDGDTVSMNPKPIFFYTHAGENDALSPNAIIPGPIRPIPPTGTLGDAGGLAYTKGGGNIVGTVGTLGACMTVGNDPNVDSLGYWESPFGDISLVSNAAYRIRLTLNGTQTQKDTVPIWDVVIQNIKVDAGWDPANPDFSKIHGKQCYGADYYMFDNMGGQNAYVQLTKGNAVYDFWWTPPAVLTARWNDTSDTKPGVYAASADPRDRNGLVWFRILDSKKSRGADTDLHAAKGVGTLCLTQMEVGRIDMGDLKTDPQLVWQTGKTSADWDIATWAPTPPVGGAWCFFTNSQASMTKVGTGTTADPYALMLKTGATDSTGDFYGSIQPGDYARDLFTEALNVDNFPCRYEAKTLYKVTYMLSAPTQADEDAAIDVFWLSAEMMTDEELFESYMTNMAWAHGMPAFKVAGQPDGTPQPFVFLFYSNYGSNLDNGNLPAFWRSFSPKLALSNNHNFTGGSLATRNGRIKFSGMTVEKVTNGGI